MLHKSLFGQNKLSASRPGRTSRVRCYTNSGAAISEGEMRRFNAQLEGAGDTESRLAAIRDIQGQLDSVERNAMAQASPEGQSVYLENKRKAQTSGPSSLSSIGSFQAHGDRVSERVNVVGPYGEQGSVDAADLPSVVKAGGRQTTPEEEASIRADAECAKKSTGEKIGSALSMAGPGPMLIRGAYKLATGQGAELAPSLPLRSTRTCTASRMR